MISMFNKAFILADPRVLGVEAHSDHATDPHLTWSCSYSTPEMDEDGDNDFRVVIATLHGANEEASFTITMGSIFIDSGVHDVNADYAQQLEKSEALESLYDLCRLQARTALGMLSMEGIFEMPSKAPEVEITELGKSEQEPAETDESESATGTD
ncbi:hypothetical protein [Paenarthrobacter histidinolovorans]|uniref:hypothetical protein n=1 Tax=Paenarthrobacter histidinolovorans TaxID=43664 RepID=UPI0016655519|nr:hypothetical protein [Paenarthrobacter histidinolovorans]GGJ21570.1 hypothetical protein GCM10010052_18460 [Paenarthrobacter histidinolovorans]